MLLLQRHVNESVVIQSKADPLSCLVVRLCDVYPTGDATLGFIGDDYMVIRNEIFNRTTQEESADEEINTYKRRESGKKELYHENNNNKPYYG